MLTLKEHANAQLIALKEIHRLLLPFSELGSIFVPGMRAVTVKEITASLDSLCRNQSPLTWQINDGSDTLKINIQLRQKLIGILNNNSRNEALNTAVHRSLILLSLYWPLNEYMKHPLYDFPVPRNLRFEPIDFWVADHEGYQYSLNEVFLLKGKSPFTRTPFHPKDIALMDARAGHSMNFHYMKHYSASVFVKGDSVIPMILFIGSFLGSLLLFATKSVIALLFIAALGANTGTGGVIILFTLIVFAASLIAVTLLAGCLGLIKDLYNRSYLENPTQETIRLVNQIEIQASQKEYANPFLVDDLEQPVGPVLSEIEINHPPATPRAQALSSPKASELIFFAPQVNYASMDFEQDESHEEEVPDDGCSIT